jgi:hypothetical protein
MITGARITVGLVCVNINASMITEAGHSVIWKSKAMFQHLPTRLMYTIKETPIMEYYVVTFKSSTFGK